MWRICPAQLEHLVAAERSARRETQGPGPGRRNQGITEVARRYWSAAFYDLNAEYSGLENRSPVCALLIKRDKYLGHGPHEQRCSASYRAAGGGDEGLPGLPERPKKEPQDGRPPSLPDTINPLNEKRGEVEEEGAYIFCTILWRKCQRKSNELRRHI